MKPYPPREVSGHLFLAKQDAHDADKKPDNGHGDAEQDSDVSNDDQSLHYKQHDCFHTCLNLIIAQKSKSQRTMQTFDYLFNVGGDFSTKIKGMTKATGNYSASVESALF